MARKTQKFATAQYAVIQADGTAELEDGQVIKLANREQFGEGDQGMAEYGEKNGVGKWFFVLFEAAAPTPVTQRVTVCGPNLRNQDKGQFHVHAADCADLQKHASREPEYKNGWTIEVASRKDIVTEIYPPSDFQYDADTEWTDYDDIYVFPCVHNLPYEASAPDPAPEPEPEPELQTLHCKAGHDWTRPPKVGRKPEYCSEHQPAPVESQVLQCKAGHEWTREPTTGVKPAWCPEHRPQPAKPAQARTEAPTPPVSKPVNPKPVVVDSEEAPPIKVVKPKQSVDQILTQFHPDPETARKLQYIDSELRRGRENGDVQLLLQTQASIMRRLKSRVAA